MNRIISVIIPNYNKDGIIGKCLEAVFSSRYDNYEVIVVDDCSTDNSVEIIKKFRCKLIQLDKNSGASKARNVGASNSKGEILFFTDSDCLLQENTLAIVNKAMKENENGRVVIGGTYTLVPFDDTFYSTFQSVFVNYSETKKKEPDYIAAHAMAMDASLFKSLSGFQEQFLPILEDVEFSHRLRRDGCKMVMNPQVLVQHAFYFSLAKSFRNALKKSKYWVMYSITNKDMLADSGTASVELKINGIIFLLCALVILLSLVLLNPTFLLLIPAFTAANLFVSRGLLVAFYKAKGISFAVLSSFYYITLYILAIWIGTIAGTLKYLKDRNKGKP